MIMSRQERNPTYQALNTGLDVSPKSEPTQKRIAGLRPVWRHFTAHTILTQEAILEGARQ